MASGAQQRYEGETVHTTRWRSALAIGAASLIILAACGSDKKTTSTTGAPVTAAAATTSPATTTPPTTGAATTAAGTAAAGTAAATTTASTVGSGAATTTVSPSQIGLIDGIYKGTAGFTLDPKKCPADWNPHQGITDTDINLFISLATSGPLAGFGLIADGMKSYYKYINDNGGIGGRKINLDVKDDGYQPTQTKSNADEAIGSNKYAAFDAVLGTPNNLAIWDETNQECMPELFNATGSPAWGDVEGHPWTIGPGLDYFTEAQLWERWLAKEHPELKTVAEVTYNNDFGKIYHDGFAFATKGTDIKVVDQELHDAASPNLDNQFTTLASSGAQVLLIETTGVFCTQAMANIEKQTSWHPLVIMSATCASLNQFFKPLINEGLTGKGTYIVQSFKDVNDPANANDPFIQLYQKTLTAQGLDPKVTTYATGWIYAWFTVESLKNGATYVGGLDRGNMMLGARNIHATMPLVINGLTTITNGAKDAYVVEGGQMTQYTVTDPKEIGKLVQAGDLINLEGQLGTYKTIQDAAKSIPTGSTTTTG